MGIGFSRSNRELDLISLVDIIFLLLIFALLVQIGGEQGKTSRRGKGDKETTLRIEAARLTSPDRPDCVQMKVIYQDDTSRVDLPPIAEFVDLSYKRFRELEEVLQVTRTVDNYIHAPGRYDIKGVELEVEGSVPFKIVDLLVRHFSLSEQDSYSLAYWRGGQP